MEYLDFKCLSEHLSYNPVNGEITWIKSRGNKKKGDIAGFLYVSGKGSKKYLKVRFNKKNLFAHRVAWVLSYNEQPDQIDHKNGNGLDNRLINLRSVDCSYNGRNKKLQSNNKSGMSGVSQYKGKWVANIKVRQKIIRLGTFLHLFEACCSRKSAENKYNFHKNHGQDRPKY